MNIPLNINFQQILLHLFNFTLLAGGLYFLLYKPVKDFMDKRKSYYEDMEERAAKKLREAEKVEEEYKEKLTRIEAEIQEKKALAEKEINEQIGAELEEARKHPPEMLYLTTVHLARSLFIYHPAWVACCLSMLVGS